MPEKVETETPDEKLITRVMKLLAKAENAGVTPEEAEAFYAKASELMEQHGIKQAMLEAAGKAERDTIGFIRIEFGSTYWAAWKNAAQAVGYAFGFKCLVMDNSKRGHLRWFGFERELARAEVVWAHLLIQAERHAREFLATYESPEPTPARIREDRFKAKRSFIQGFGHTVAKRILEQRMNARGEATRADETNVLPVLASREAELNEYFDAIPTKALRRTNMTQNLQGFTSGQRAGNQADIGNKSVASRKALRG